MFATVLHELTSPQNVGSIVRTHVAMGGGPLVMIGREPWRFRKGTQAFSRKLERLCRIAHLTDDAAFFAWCASDGWAPVAVEIRPDAPLIADAEWPARPALVFGNERTGLSDAFLAACPQVLRIPQFGEVGSLNVAIAHGMATYELRRHRGSCLVAVGPKYPQVRERSGQAQQ